MAGMAKITVGGREYPCRVTMGAPWRFRNETGREASELDERILTDVVLWLWCCVSSACAADGVEFTLSPLEFADRLLPEELRMWASSLKAPGGDAGEAGKKNAG